MNTKIYYNYTDGANFKTTETQVLSGTLSQQELEDLIKFGNPWVGFDITKIPRLPPLGSSLPDLEGYDPELDHPFHSLLKAETTNEPSNCRLTTKKFLALLKQQNLSPVEKQMLRKKNQIKRLIKKVS